MSFAKGTPSLDELKSYDMLATSCVFLALSAITVIARIYVRAYMIRSFGWDDWLMIATFVSIHWRLASIVERNLILCRLCSP
jgi:hypothetical protein